MTRRKLAGLSSAGAVLAVLLAVLATPAGAAGTSKPAADCQPFSGQACLLPFPNNLFTRPDRSTPTGLRVNLPARALPVSTAGVRMSASEYDRNDGFSPGSAMLVHVPGLDNPAAFARTGPVGLVDMK